MKRLVLVILAAQLVGCASWYRQPDDSVGMQALKIGGRIVVGVPTMGLSELAIAQSQKRRNVLAYQRDLEDRLLRARERVEQATDREDLDFAIAKYNLVVAEARDYDRRRNAQRQGQAQAFRNLHTIQTIQNEANRTRQEVRRNRQIDNLQRSIDNIGRQPSYVPPPARRPIDCSSRVVLGTVKTTCY